MKVTNGNGKFIVMGLAGIAMTIVGVLGASRKGQAVSDEPSDYDEDNENLEGAETKESAEEMGDPE